MEGGVDIAIKPKGLYRQATQEYLLQVRCLLFSKNTEGGHEDSFVDVLCIAKFVFNEPLTKEQIPDYFYPNSVAIIFPYVRAMISTLTLQANRDCAVILPTMNLSNLQEELKRNTEVE